VLPGLLALSLFSIAAICNVAKASLADDAVPYEQHDFAPSLNEPPDPDIRNPCRNMPNPCTVVSDTADSTAFKSALKRTPLKGGTIVVMPGTYTVDRQGYVFLTNRDWLTIVAVLGPDGKLPII
jgi:hypothetical protein